MRLNGCNGINIDVHDENLLIQKLYADDGIPGCLRLGLSWFIWWISFAPEFQCCYFCESSCLFYLSFNFDFYVSKIMHLLIRNFPRNQTTKCLRNKGRTKGEGWSTTN